MTKATIALIATGAIATALYLEQGNGLAAAFSPFGTPRSHSSDASANTTWGESFFALMQSPFGSIGGNDAESANQPATLGQQIDTLSLSAQHGNGDDAMLAYQLATECATLSLDDTLTASLPAEADSARASVASENDNAKLRCASVTSRQLYDRFRNVEIAMNAGIRDAAIQFYLDGPDGDISKLVSQPDDWGVKQWKAEAEANLRRLASVGDKEAISLLSVGYETGQALDRNYTNSYSYSTVLSTLVNGNGNGNGNGNPGLNTEANQNHPNKPNILAARLSPADLLVAQRNASDMSNAITSAHPGAVLLPVRLTSN